LAHSWKLSAARIGAVAALLAFVDFMLFEPQHSIRLRDASAAVLQAITLLYAITAVLPLVLSAPGAAGSPAAALRERMTGAFVLVAISMGCIILAGLAAITTLWDFMVLNLCTAANVLVIVDLLLVCDYFRKRVSAGSPQLR